MMLLLDYCTLISSDGKGSWSINPIDSPGLICDPLGFHYTVYPKWNGHLSVKLTAFDQQGRAHVLSTHKACKTWIKRHPSGSVALRASYNGCYAYEENNENLMTISVEKEYIPGNWTFLQVKELRCPKLGVTVRCTQDEHISIAISKDLTRPSLKLDSVHMIAGNEEACKPVLRTNGFILFQFSPSTCGITSKEIDGIVIYETIILANIDVTIPNDTSIRSSVPIRLHIHCSLVSSDLPTQNTGALIQSPVTNGIPESFTLQMRFAEDYLYLKYYDGDYPVVKLLEDFIPIEVLLLPKNDSNLTLALHECWATPTEDPNTVPQWPFLVNGCPFTGGHYKSYEVFPASPVGLQFQSHYKRLIVNAVKPAETPLDGGLVYFHCRVFICLQSALDPCIPLCLQRELVLGGTKRWHTECLQTCQGSPDYQG
ncbi:zona pellucida sperm-binding protein 4-like [Rhinoderma darwinii]|uniref:zona pellucida sperm-binding protein 4-like n=1 Tax=Rhinoderma darwinii TaxID=43563 RepID=UPI003F67C000